MYNYEFINGTDISTVFTFDKSVMIPSKGKFTVSIDDTAPTSLKVYLAKMKKVLSTNRELVATIIDIKKEIGVIPYTVTVREPIKVEEKKAEPKEEVEEKVVLKSLTIERYNPVMHVGESQKIGFKVEGFPDDEKPVFVSSNENVVRVTRAGRVAAMGEGDAWISVSLGDVKKTLRVEVEKVEDLQITEE